MTPFTQRSVAAFLHALASRQPAPGGGSAAALAAASGAALYVMVGRIVSARSLPVAQRRAVQRTVAACERHRWALVRLVDTDARVYGRLVEVWRRTKGRPSKGLRQAQRQALRAPLAICAQAAAALRQAPGLARLAGRHLGSDVAAASALLVGGFSAAAATVAANLEAMGQDRQARAIRRRVQRIWMR